MSPVLPDRPAKLDPERQARLFNYLATVLVAGDSPPDVDPDTAAALAGMVLGLRTGLLEQVRGMTRELAYAASVRWVHDQATLWGSLAATTDGKLAGE